MNKETHQFLIKNPKTLKENFYQFVIYNTNAETNSIVKEGYNVKSNSV